MKHLYLIFAFLTSISAFSQNAKMAKALYNQGNFSAALTEFEKVLKQNPGDYYIHQLAGECYLKMNVDRSAAVTHLKKTVDSGKYHKDALFLLAEAYAQNYEFDLAIDYYNQYLQTVSRKDRKSTRLNSS